MENAPPPTWVGQAGDFGLHDVVIGSPEFDEVSRMFFASLTQGMGIVHLDRVQRIQNRPLWEAYVRHRAFVAERNGGDANEAQLWHGTRSVRPEDLYQKKEVAFDMRYCDAGLWGRGSYFAEPSRYSLAYAHRRADGTKQLLLALVARGRVDDHGTTTKRELRTPADGCHSVGATTQGCKICVLYQTMCQAFPQYLVSFSDRASPRTVAAPAVPFGAPAAPRTPIAPATVAAFGLSLGRVNGGSKAGRRIIKAKKSAQASRIPPTPAPPPFSFGGGLSTPTLAAPAQSQAWIVPQSWASPPSPFSAQAAPAPAPAPAPAAPAFSFGAAAPAPVVAPAQSQAWIVPPSWASPPSPFGAQAAPAPAAPPAPAAGGGFTIGAGGAPKKSKAGRRILKAKRPPRA